MGIRAHPAYLVMALAGLIMLAPLAPAQTLNGFELKDSLVPPDQILHGGPGRDGIPAIDAPKFMPAGAANLATTDRVLGPAQAFDSAGQELPAYVAFWFAWSAFYPKAEAFVAHGAAQ